MAGIASDMLRGHTDTIILRFLREKDSYGYEINKRIREVTDGLYELNEATLYTAFRRLEKSQLISSYWGNENSGARRRYYSITAAGRAAYEEDLQEWEKSRDMIERLLK
ncbi:MAG: helix-turn-helix transcriptional regulator [Erysipelotrichaceae bacterium]|nr:helix-turn-helix transcriptional regulator [Erysipelotrichaceae bacterium]